MSDQQIISDPDVLDSIDPDTAVLDRRGDVHLAHHSWRVPCAILATGEQVRAARKALEKETE